MTDLFSGKPLVISALHLPDFGPPTKPIEMARLEDYVSNSMTVFVKGGVLAEFPLDETLFAPSAQPETTAI